MATAINYAINLTSAAAVRATAALQTGMQSLASTAARLGQMSPLGGLTNGLGAARSGLAGLQGGMSGIAGSFLSIQTVVASAAAVFAKSAIDAANTAEAAFKGLESVANGTGVGIEGAWSAVIELTQDGILSTTEAATALKNLFSRGFNLQESIRLIGAFKDASAYGRQAGLQWGEAVVTATEGLKNENSALVDNAGITKNVAKMWEEYAQEHTLVAANLTLSEKRHAELNGVLKETRNNAGDAAKAMNGNAGAAARLTKSFTDLKVAVGAELSPAFADAQQTAAVFLEEGLKPILGTLNLAIAAAKIFAGVVALPAEVLASMSRSDTGTQFQDDLRKNTEGKLRSIDKHIAKGLPDLLGYTASPDVAGLNAAALEAAKARSARLSNAKKAASEADAAEKDARAAVAPPAGKAGSIPPLPTRPGLYGMTIPPLPGGMNLPPLDPNAKLPPLPTKAGTRAPAVSVPGLRGPTQATEKVQNNIDEDKVAANAAAAQAEEDKAAAKSALTLSEKALSRKKQAAADELAIFKSGLDAQQAVLNGMRDKDATSRVAAVREGATLETQALVKEEELRVRRIGELQVQSELATKTGDKEKLADAEAELATELAQREVAFNKLDELRTKAAADERAAAQGDADERMQVTNTLLKARLDAEKTTGEAIRDRNLQDTKTLHEQNLITTEEYIRRNAAIKDKELADELARIKQLQEANAKASTGTDPVRIATAKAEGIALAAQTQALEAKRATLNAEANGKIYESTAKLAEMRADLDQQLLEAEGKTLEARTAQIDAWLAAKKLEFAAFPDMLATAEATAAAQHRGNRFDTAQEGINSINADYSKKAADAQRLNGAGKMTDIGLDIENVRLAKEQVAVLRERLSVLKENANASPAQVEAIATLGACRT